MSALPTHPSAWSCTNWENAPLVTRPRAEGLPVTGLCLLQVGSFGNGTVLRNEADVELVVFLSCFHSFREEAKYHQTVLRLIWEKVWCCQDLLDLGLSDLRITQGVPNALDFTIQTRGTAEPINITIVPAYRALGKGSGNLRLPKWSSLGDFQIPHLSLLIP